MLRERGLLGSVVIPANDEALVIRRCLDALFEGFAPGSLDVVVVCNGCADDTAAQASSSGHPVRVLELAAASKPAALRAGDAAALAFPRIYLDADVVLPGRAARALLERLRTGAIAGRPPIRYDSIGASAPVRSYYRARSRVPAVLGSLWGAGVYGLSAEGRRRFGEFPDVVGDDLWVDRLFDLGEVEIVDCAPVVVTVPRRAGDLVRLLRRTYRGKAETAPMRPNAGKRPCLPRCGTSAGSPRPVRAQRSTRPPTARSRQAPGCRSRSPRPPPAPTALAGNETTARGRPDMWVQASAAGSTFDVARQITSRSHAVPVLQLFALTVMVIPSDTVINAIGAAGYPAGLGRAVRVRRVRRRDRPRAATIRCNTDTRSGACSACSG